MTGFLVDTKSQKVEFDISDQRNIAAQELGANRSHCEQGGISGPSGCAPMVERLRADHEVRSLDVRSLIGASAIAQEQFEGPADLYLLRGDAPQAAWRM